MKSSAETTHSDESVSAAAIGSCQGEALSTQALPPVREEGSLNSEGPSLKAECREHDGQVKLDKLS